MNTIKFLSLILAAIGIFTPNTAAAYIGPGAGVGAIALTLALLLGVILLFVGLVWYPLKRALKGNKRKAEKIDDAKKVESN